MGQQIMHQFYESALNRNRGVINLANDPFKLALLANTYEPYLGTHKIWSDISAHEISDGDGYTLGGKALTGIQLTRISSITIFSAHNVLFEALTKTFRYGILYVDATKSHPLGGDDIVKPLYSYILFDDTPADIVVDGVDYIVQWSGLGISRFGPRAAICG